MRLVLAILCMACAASTQAYASSFTLSGLITQSTADGTGPAVRNPSLNNVLSLQPYSLTLDSATAITGPGLYNLTGSSLIFSVPLAGATESGFGAITLSVITSGSAYNFSLLACLEGADCLASNQLTANFQIAAAMLGGTGVMATGLDQPHPLNLLEDDGTTDLQGSITTYSATGIPSTVTPEPDSFLLLAFGLSATGVLARVRNRFSFRRLQ